MATLAAGSTVSVYCPLTGTMTVTPGTSGRVSINARGRDGSQSLAPRELYTTETLSVNAGDVVSLEAINVAATYTDPAEAGPALQALVSEAWNVRADGGSRSYPLKQFSDAAGVTAANSGTAATVSIDPASPYGRPAYRVVMPAGNTYHEVLLTGLNLGAFDGHVIWSVWVEDHTKVLQIQAFAGTSGYVRFWQQTHNVNNSGTNRINGEHKIVVGPTAAGVTNTFVAGTDEMDDTKLRIFPGAAGATVWVDACVVPGAGRATHILTYDDCSVTWIGNVLPHLAANGLLGTFGVNTGDLNGNPSFFLSTAQLQFLAAAGHQVSPHNVANNSVQDGTGGGDIALAAYLAEWISASGTLTGLVGSAFDGSYHPWVKGRTNQAAMDALRGAGMTVARGTDNGYNYPQAGLGNHVLQLKAQSLHTLTTDGAIDAICDNANKYGATVVWMVHEVLTTGGSDGVGGDVETNVAKHAYLCNRIRRDVRGGLAVTRTAGAFGRELYAQRLVAAALLS